MPEVPAATVVPKPQPPPRKSFKNTLADAIKPYEESLTKPVAEPAATQPTEQAKPAGQVDKQSAASPAPAVVPSPTPAQPDPDESILSEKRAARAEDWEKLRGFVGKYKSKAEQAEAKYSELTKKLEEAEKKPKHNAELIAKLEQERDLYKTKFEEVAVEFSPDFNAKYAGRVNAAIENLKSAIPAEVMPDVAAILQMPDSKAKNEKLQELVSNMDDLQRTEVLLANREVKGILTERQSAIAKANETLTKTAEEKQAKLKERFESYKKEFSSQLAKMKDPKDGIPTLVARDGDEEWNNSVAERERVAAAIFEDRFESPAEKAEAAIWAASAPSFLSELKSKSAKIAELEATIAKMQASNPSVTTAPKSGTMTATTRKSFAQKMSETLSGQ